MWPNTIISRNLSLNEQRWLENINQNFIIDIDIHPCVFAVPETLKETKPEAYVPKKLGLGPYQHFHHELHQLECQKRSAAKKFLKPQHFFNFKDLVVKRLIEIGPTIRACYDRYVDLEGNTLAWILAIDSVYLLHFLSTYLERKDKGLLVDSSMEELARDVLVLENQIPVVILTEILTALRSFPPDNTAATDYPLFDHFYRFCQEQSPLELANGEEVQEMKNEHCTKHLLHYMYQLILYNRGEETERKVLETSKVQRAIRPSQFTAVAQFAISEGTQIVREAVNEVNSAITSATSSGIKVPGNLQNVSRVLQTLQKSFSLSDKSETRQEHDFTDFTAYEIDVPSVAQLCHIAKITFMLTHGGIRDIKLDEKQNILYLPVITLRANSNVALRNLLAYEAVSADENSTLELASYVDLMCGIVDTPEDVNLLRNAGIIKGDLTYEEILEIFNGFKKSTGKRSNEKSSLEKIADEVRKQFHHIWVVKASKCIRKSFDDSKKFLQPLLSIMLFLVLAMELYKEFFNIFGREAAGNFALHDASFLGLGPPANPNIYREVYM